MAEHIGTDAGVVWRYLDERGEGTVSGVAKGTGLKTKQVDRAIGWLAREGKLTIHRDRNREVLSVIREPVAG